MPKTTGIKALLLLGAEKMERARQIAGAFWYTDYEGEPDVGIIHSCPCGCGLLSAIHLKPHAGVTSPMWSINGSRDAPTLSPSVGIHAHGPDSDNERAKVKEADGVWESC